ncbi:MAG: hypothetical protein FWD83_05805 [Promicromonosporaceae bacterium]|nr:hypothetical protein [Promicromonosporaceae bacterium]
MSRHQIAPDSQARGRLRRVGVTIATTVAILAGLAFAGRSMQHHIAYHPSRSPLPPAVDVLPWAQEVVLTTDDGLELIAWFVPPAPGIVPRNQAVLFAHGNGGALDGRASALRRPLRSEALRC